MQTTLLGLAIAIILALVTAIVAPLVIDWNHYRDPIEAEASRLTGMTVRINGSIDARLVPMPMITLHDVETGASGAAGGQPLLRAGEIKLELALGALLRGKIEATDAHLIEPELQLGLDRSGALALPAMAPSFRAAPLSIAHFSVENGRVVLTDAVSGARLVLQKLWFDGQMAVARRAVQRPRRDRRRRSALRLPHLRQPGARRRHAVEARRRSVRPAADDAVRRHAQICPRRAALRRHAGAGAAGRGVAGQRQARRQRAVARGRRDCDHAVGGQAPEPDIPLWAGRTRAEFHGERGRGAGRRSRALPASCPPCSSTSIARWPRPM